MRNRITAALFALFLGGLGIHKFYLGRVGWGVVYLLFCWTFIPAVLGFIEAIILLVMSDAAFRVKYGGNAIAPVIVGGEVASPDTHVRCPECRQLVRIDASLCPHCRTKLVPQSA